MFRDVDAPVHDELMASQLEAATQEKGAGDLEALLRARETWVVD